MILKRSLTYSTFRLTSVFSQSSGVGRVTWVDSSPPTRPILSERLTNVECFDVLQDAVVPCLPRPSHRTTSFHLQRLNLPYQLLFRSSDVSKLSKPLLTNSLPKVHETTQIYDFFTRSLPLTLAMYRTILLSHTSNNFVSCCVSAHVSAPYGSTGRTHTS